MPAQDEDPIVFNQATSKFQNASNSQASGQPKGITIGPPGGSTVRMAPTVGNTILINGTQTATIESAFQMASGAVTEDVPAYSCSIVINQGLGNEILGHMTISGLNAATAQAMIMLSQSADGSIAGSTKVGTVVPGGSTTYTFSSLHDVWPKSMEHQYAKGMGIYASDQTGATLNAEGWTLLFSLGYQNGFSGASSSTEYGASFRWAPLHDGVIFWRGLIQTPSSGNVNNVTIATLPNSYHPTNFCRVPALCTSSPSSGSGYMYLHQDGNLQFQGIPSLNSATFDITGTMHPGL